MRILGLDQSITRTGWAVLDGPPAQLSTLMSGWFSCADRSDTAHFGKEIAALIIDTGPSFVVFEKPRATITTYGKKSLVPGDYSRTPNASQLVLPWIAGMIEQACIDRGLPYEMVPPGTWRAAVIGGGAGGYDTKAAKKAAKLTCDRLGITYANEDQAEASLIALYGTTCQTLRMLLHRGAA